MWIKYKVYVIEFFFFIKVLDLNYNLFVEVLLIKFIDVVKLMWLMGEYYFRFFLFLL